MKFIALAALAAITLASGLGNGPSFAQDSGTDDIGALRSEIEELKRGQLLILRELEALRRALGRTPDATARECALGPEPGNPERG